MVRLPNPKDFWRGAVYGWRMSDGSLKRAVELGKEQGHFRTIGAFSMPFMSLTALSCCLILPFKLSALPTIKHVRGVAVSAEENIHSWSLRDFL
jgi:hypothetical protein